MYKRNIYLYLFWGLTVLCVFFLSLFVDPYYIAGDQLNYNLFYNEVKYFNIADGFEFYRNSLGTREPGYFILAWLSSGLGIEKTYFVVFFNVLLAFFAYRYLTKIGGHPTIVFFIISFNFYSYVLFFAAERLKIGFLFFTIALVYNQRGKLFYLLSVITHAQMIVLFVSVLMIKMKEDILDLFFRLKVNLKFLAVVVFISFASLFVFIAMQEHFISKFNSYFELRGLLELLKLLVFFALSYLYSKDKASVIICFVPLFIFALIFGGERINFLGYFIFLYFSLSHKKGFNLGVILTGIYFIFTGYIFISKVIEYGNGFYNI